MKNYILLKKITYRSIYYMKTDGDGNMEITNTFANENIIDSYALKPNLFYNVEGLLVEKDGKQVKVEKNLDHIKVVYFLRLVDEIDAKVGEKVVIPKENISYMRIDKKKENVNINVKETISKLGLEDTEEVRGIIECLVENDIPINRNTIESFLASKMYLKEIVENLDFDSCIMLMGRDIDLKKDSLQKIAEALGEIKGKNKNFLREFFSLTRSLSYREAEKIAEEIYNRKMGKDVYDAIIALHRHNIPINKANIERVLEAVNKLYDLKNCSEEVFVRVVAEQAPANIETLYKFKYSYKKGEIDENIAGILYEQFTVVKEPTLEDILGILKELNIINNQENIQLAREFLMAGVEINKTDFEKVKTMKHDLKELISIADEENMARLIKEGVDPLKEDISKLVGRIKHMDKDEKPPLSKMDGILKELDILNEITDRDLLELIRRGEDFKLENLKRIVETGTESTNSFENQVVQKAITISNIFNTLGNLSSEAISLAARKYQYISLNNLYSCHMDLSSGREVTVVPIDRAQESIIRQEYLNIRNNTTLNLIKESIKDRVSIEHMPLDELNEYIDRKVLKYRETQRLLKEISFLKGKEDSIIPAVMKNRLNMSLKDLSYTNSVLNRGMGIGDVFNNLVKDKNSYQEGLKEQINTLEGKIKEFTKFLKEGKESIQKDYKEIFESFEELANSFDFHEDGGNSHMEDMRDYIELQHRMSNKDLVLQLPISLGSEYSNINLIIPNISKGIDKKNMDFYISLNTENLGQIKLSLKVRNKRVYVDFDGDKYERILDNKSFFERNLEKLGYSLEKI